ncbi:MAG: iron hydrogenase small subunit, partial [Treponema sp.]|nr:iron hydrogenase small subunit [Treponema sp.]
KYEGARKEFEKGGKRNIEFVLTSQELIRLIKEAGIDYANIKPENIEEHYGNTTGAAVLFGVTGGVTEAALRYATPDKTEAGYKAIAESGIRGLPHPDAKAGTLVDGIKVAEVKLGDATLRIAVVSGLANAVTLIDRIKAGEHFDFAEVMACPGGCIGGGGQPPADWDVKAERAKGLYLADKQYPLNSSEKNPVMKEWIDGVLKGPHTPHEVLHVSYGHGHGGH